MIVGRELTLLHRCASTASLGALLAVKWQQLSGGVAEWLRHSASNLVRSPCVGSNPVVGITNHMPTVKSNVILPRSVNENSEVTLRAQALEIH